MTELKEILLIDLPTFPKGIVPLGLPSVAAALPEKFTVNYYDFNISGYPNDQFIEYINSNLFFVGIKVSSQNYDIAIELSTQIKQIAPETNLVWGGEYPSLLPEEAIKYADSIVKGSFEPIAEQLIQDLLLKKTKIEYDGNTPFNASAILPARLDIIKSLKKYNSFMGIPIETTRGCDKKCTFCMVHVMQPHYNLRSYKHLKTEIEAIDSSFINVVDYNIGVNKSHLIKIASIIESSNATGWMAETILENLDDDEILNALAKSNCKMVYCGLESIDENALISINKKTTNRLENYERIIKKVQSRGIQVAAGLILGIEGMTKETFYSTLKQFEDWGLIYTKLTFLTYNPGTKVYSSMKRKGSYLRSDHSFYDGNHLTFLPNGISKDVVHEGAKWYIKNFYSLTSIRKRAKNSGLKFKGRIEFILFNLCYRWSYQQWLKHHILDDEKSSFKQLLTNELKIPLSIRVYQSILKTVRKSNRT